MTDAVVSRLMSMCRRSEGIRLKSYRCPAGIWTIGVGATGRDIGPGLVWTLDQAINRLERDCVRSVAETYKLCPNLLREHPERVAAVADFVFNLGATRLAASTMRRYILKGDWEMAARECLKWVWGGGKKLPGLQKRRAEEAEMFRGNYESASDRPAAVEGKPPASLDIFQSLVGVFRGLAQGFA